MADNTCTATTRAGSPCRRKKVHGSELCQAHGGARHKPNDIIAKALDGIEKPRCVYTKRDGVQCKNAPIKGGTVCKKHGGAAAHIQRKAKERLQEMVLPALAQLNKIVTAPGTSDGDKLRAIAMVLDRTGYGKGMTVEHVQSKPWEITMEHIITEMPDYELELEADDIEDAEVVEESLGPIRDYSRHEQFDGPRINHEGRVAVRVGSADPPERSR